MYFQMDGTILYLFSQIAGVRWLSRFGARAKIFL